MGYDSITLKELQELGKRTDLEFVVAKSLRELYLKLNRDYPSDKWTSLRAPIWIDKYLVQLMIKPRDDTKDDYCDRIVDEILSRLSSVEGFDMVLNKIESNRDVDIKQELAKIIYNKL